MATRSARAHILPFQLATLADRPPAGKEWVHEEKLDGYRVQLQKRGRDVRLFTRGGQDWSARFPRIVREGGAVGARDAVLDGEIIARDEEGRSSFQHLQQAMQPGADAAALEYRAFDLLQLDGVDLRREPLAERRRLLKKLIARRSGKIRLTSEVRGAEPLETACRAGLEGVVSKRLDAPYEGTRTHTWIKSKCQRRQEFIVVGFTEPKGSRAGLGALLLGVRDGDAVRYAGKVGTGLDVAGLVALRARLAQLERSSSPLVNGAGPRERGVHWVRPSVVVEVRFTEWTSDGRLRHPVFQGVREDKRARLVHREDPMPEAAITITHPDRLVFEHPPITKGQLAAYYETVAPLMLPHVVGRPLSVLRCPEGQEAQCFYQKHWTKSAAAVPTKEIAEKEGVRRRYAVIEDLEGLLALVQFGVLEIHPWGSRADRPDAPDRIIFDLDPGPRVRWTAVIDAARELRALLRALGLESWLKTTGGKGLHVVLPLERTVKWDVASLFARTVAERLASEAPERFVTVASKAARPGRIFVDWLRNTRGATAVAPWSTRARPGAPVAMPIRWEELGDLKGGDAFDVGSALARVRKKVRDPWAGMAERRQRISPSVVEKLGHP